jgi:diadenosine tetraphosphatase ApaH/serine/threonine PP2A family protein phosphatase
MLALLYDIHGNLPALEAVLDDARAQGASRYALGGDYCAFGPWPVQTLERVEGLGAEVVLRGNHERWLGDRDAIPDNADVRAAVDWEARHLGSARAARLEGLATGAELDGMLLCHASPGADVGGFAPGGDEEDAALLHGVTARRVVCGHTHVQFSRLAATGTEIVNPGSVGLPFDGDQRAAYALVDADGAVELRRVAYDVGATRVALQAIGEPWTALIDGWLEHARP